MIGALGRIRDDDDARARSAVHHSARAYVRVCLCVLILFRVRLSTGMSRTKIDSIRRPPPRERRACITSHAKKFPNQPTSAHTIMSSAVVRWPDTDADQSLYTDGHNYNKHVCIVYGAIS